MKKIALQLWLALTTAALAFHIACAQTQEPELTLTFSRDFGYASGTGKIQGTFSMKVSGPDDLVRVVFLIDDRPIGEDTEPPFRLQFNTDAYPLGVHTLSAVGYTADGRELHSRKYQREFVSASEGWQAALKITIPLLALVLVVSLLSILGPFLLKGKRKEELPLGTPRKYGIAGGAICPRCQRPFALHFLSFNMITGKLDRCPYCGKWSIVRSRPLSELRAAEAAELEQAQQSAPSEPVSEEEQLRKELDASRYQDM